MKTLLLLAVVAVIGFSGNVAAEVFQVVESQHHELAGGRVPDDLLVLLVEAHPVFEDQFPLCSGQLERHLLAGLNLFLGGHDCLLAVVDKVILAGWVEIR